MDLSNKTRDELIEYIRQQQSRINKFIENEYRMRAAFRVNALRWIAPVNHDDIDAEIDRIFTSDAVSAMEAREPLDGGRSLLDEARKHFNEPMIALHEVVRLIGYGEDDSDCYYIVRHMGGKISWNTCVGGYTFLDRLKGQGYVKSTTGEEWDDLKRLDSALALNGAPPEIEMVHKIQQENLFDRILELPTTYIPQRFRLLDKVRIGPNAPAWGIDLEDVIFTIVGIELDTKRPGRSSYVTTDPEGELTDAFAEDWLESAQS